MLRFPLAFCLFLPVLLHAQNVARPSNIVPLSTTGEFIISTRKVPGAAAGAQPEVYEIITGKDGGATLTLGALGTVKMEKETQIRMPAVGATQSLEMLKGKLFFNIDAAEIKKNQNTEFRLKTPAALLAVKGTQFFVETNAGEETIGVFEGAAAIANSAARSATLLKKGQASTHGQAQPLQPRPMQPEELAQSAIYASTLPVTHPALPLVVGDTTGMAEYMLKGDISTVSKDDAQAISQLGPTVMIMSDPPQAARLKLEKSGVIGVFSTQTRGAATALRFKLVFRQPQNLNAVALRFYLRSRPDFQVSVDGRTVGGAATTLRAAAQNQPTPWSDCMLDLHARPGTEPSFMLELTRSAAKSNAKPNASILELSDFTCLSPAAP